MNFIDKLKKIMELKYSKDKKDKNLLYGVINWPLAWNNYEINNLKETYSWLSQAYLDFLKNYDGLELDFIRFYGSEKGGSISLISTMQKHREYLNNIYFSFGYYADGSNFIFNKKNEVFWWDKQDYEFKQKPKFLAASFEEFMNECVLGPRYNEFADVEENDFYKFLQSQNWA